ncbi:hypothetical protein BDW74DRAFT_180413 [Aspergillus multicolor]|uniref:bZIP transcription factor n=1 Tax=Aspergillus multicolor TaxID=41759 RepID=UPI003CCE0900
MLQYTTSNHRKTTSIDPNMFDYYTAFSDESLAMPQMVPFSPPSTDEESPSHTPSLSPSPTPSPIAGVIQQQTKPKSQRRGRPKILDTNGEELASKERRKAQVRQAQRAYRSRKEEQTAVLMQRVAELEQKLLLVRGLYLSTHDAVMTSSASLLLEETNLKMLHDNMQILLADTDIDAPAGVIAAPSLSSLASSSGAEIYALDGNWDVGMTQLEGQDCGLDSVPNMPGIYDMTF